MKNLAGTHAAQLAKQIERMAADISAQMTAKQQRSREVNFSH